MSPIDKAIETAIISRSCLLPLIGANHPPHTASLPEVVKHYGNETPLQQQRINVWRAWAALEGLREVVDQIAFELAIQAAETVEGSDA